MLDAIEIDAAELAEVFAYATIEPVGEPMADYSGGRSKRAEPMDPEKRRALLRAILPSSEKGDDDGRV